MGRIRFCISEAHPGYYYIPGELPDNGFGKDYVHAADYEALERRLAEVEAELKDANEKLKYTYCAWCGQGIEISDVERAKEFVADHVRSCPDHPYAELKAERDRIFENAVNVLTSGCEKHKKVSIDDLKGCIVCIKDERDRLQKAHIKLAKKHGVLLDRLFRVE